MTNLQSKVEEVLDRFEKTCAVQLGGRKSDYEHFAQQILKVVREETATIKRWVFTTPQGLEMGENGEPVPREIKDELYIKESDLLALLNQE